jgi:ATP-dependent Lon protease
VQRNLGGVQLILHGDTRGTAVHYTETNGYLEATVRETPDLPPLNEKDAAFVALHREVRERAAELGQKSGLPTEVVQQVLQGVRDPGALADLVAGHLTFIRRSASSCSACRGRLAAPPVHARQLAMLAEQAKIKSQVQEELGERQREMILREQLKAIRKELGKRRAATSRIAKRPPWIPRRPAPRSNASWRARAHRPRLDGAQVIHLPRDHRGLPGQALRNRSI